MRLFPIALLFPLGLAACAPPAPPPSAPPPQVAPGTASVRPTAAMLDPYVGSYRSRFRILQGEERLTRYEDAEAGTTRSFCARCGTPMLYERARSPTMVNIPRAVFRERTGRETRYHMNLDEAADWTWAGEDLKPLKGYPGVMWTPPRKTRPKRPEGMF